MPLISIVIPCFNYGAYLLETIKSIDDQTFRDFEVIVVDDGSKEEYTRSVLKKLESREIRVIYQGNSGPAAARNNGIQHSSGKYVLTLDADDTLEPEFLQKTLALFDTGSDIIGASSFVRQFGANTGIIRCKGGTVAGFVGDCPVVAALFLKSRWQEIDGYDETMRLGYEDWEFWIRFLAPAGRIAIVSEPLLNYRVKPGSRVDQSKSNRVQIMEYMLYKNREIYTKYAVEAILGCEKYLDAIEKKYKAEINRIYQCPTFRTGSVVLSPFRFLKNMMTKTPG
ncbi:MAG: glycosyltransferase family A protein [Bacteroidetes bacterium]|nr:glycosyltransferase family A protein [Bacteroidota bacterium]